MTARKNECYVTWKCHKKLVTIQIRPPSNRPLSVHISHAQHSFWFCIHQRCSGRLPFGHWNRIRPLYHYMLFCVANDKLNDSYRRTLNYVAYTWNVKIQRVLFICHWNKLCYKVIVRKWQKVKAGYDWNRALHFVLYLLFVNEVEMMRRIRSLWYSKNRKHSEHTHTHTHKTEDVKEATFETINK